MHFGTFPTHFATKIGTFPTCFAMIFGTFPTYFATKIGTFPTLLHGKGKYIFWIYALFLSKD
jgi:hypothetical protein